MTLTKQDIIRNIGDKIGLTKQHSTAIVEDIFAIIKDDLAKGNPVKISGFGKWIVANKKARIGRNPKTGEKITIAARKVTTFRPSEILKKEL
jgi:integration host factor subunit alpha